MPAIGICAAIMRVLPTHPQMRVADPFRIAGLRVFEGLAAERIRSFITAIMHTNALPVLPNRRRLCRRCNVGVV